MGNNRIVFFCGTLMQGGAERVISVLSKKFCEIGLDVSILYYYDSEIFYDVHPNVKLFCVERSTETHNKIKNLLWTHKFFKKNADVVISFMASLNIFAIIAHIGLKTPIIVADRSDPYIVPNNFFVRKTRDFLYHFADKVVLQTKRNFNYFSKSIQKKGSIIFNPTDIGEYKGLALSTQKNKRIVSVGRLIPSKNYEMLINAFAKLTHVYPEYTLTIYGDGKSKPNLENYISDLGLNEKIFLPGNEKNVFEKTKDADLFVLPSNIEGMPNALIEAMCLGLPVISTNVSGAGDFIINEKNGLLIDCKNLSQLVSAMEKMLSDENFRKSCAEQAVGIIEKVNTDTIVKEWVGLIY